MESRVKSIAQGMRHVEDTEIVRQMVRANVKPGFPVRHAIFLPVKLDSMALSSAIWFAHGTQPVPLMAVAC